MERDQKQMDDIEAILIKRVGKKNAITAREIANTVGIKDNDTFINTRMLIRKLMKNKQLPIGALDNGGYFIIENEKELNDYSKMLDRRANGIVTRKARAIVYFENYYKQDFTGTEEEI
ncbi:MAG: hypothetical protein ABSF44_04130 [Candidatus Bathyarchaeia archaeon]|jgi:hypothetical protein